MWLSHPYFPDVVREAWARPTDLPQAAFKFTEKAKIWNKNVFGNLFTRKKRVTARLRGIQVALASNPTSFLVNLERDLRVEFMEVSKLEEEFWALKSRITWLVEGDRNRGFYHTTALVRRRRNRISCIKDRVGNWINDEQEVADYIRHCFAELYTSSHNHSLLDTWNPPFWQAQISDDESRSLVDPITDEEIAAGLWSIKPFKALGPDSLHVGFFQRFWLLLGDSVRDEVKRIFTSGKIPNFLNHTFVTLVPKCKNPKSINSYRPISLCNYVYKIVSKILVARIRPLLVNLISPLQIAFVPGRKVSITPSLSRREFIPCLGRKGGVDLWR